MAKIEIYTRPGCGYCAQAKQLLANKGLEFVEYDVFQYPENLKTMQNRTNGRTFPQIFIEDKLIGGYTDLLSHKYHGLFTNN
ncbi:MAG: glutaredoxin 3 [Alteromonadaceae bacterium]|jgi:glutaredoxin 3